MLIFLNDYGIQSGAQNMKWKVNLWLRAEPSLQYLSKKSFIFGQILNLFPDNNYSNTNQLWDSQLYLHSKNSACIYFSFVARPPWGHPERPHDEVQHLQTVLPILRFLRRGTFTSGAAESSSNSQHSPTSHCKCKWAACSAAPPSALAAAPRQRCRECVSVCEHVLGMATQKVQPPKVGKDAHSWEMNILNKRRSSCF